MNVRQLITKLMLEDPDATVVVFDSEADLYAIVDSAVKVAIKPSTSIGYYDEATDVDRYIPAVSLVA